MDCRPEVTALINVSPRLALAVAEEKQFVPYMMVVSDSWTTTGVPAPLLNVPSDPTNIKQDLLILAVDVDIQTKDFNTGSVLKPQADAFYDQTSGIQCDVRIDGFKARVTPYFPLKVLPTLGTIGAGGAGGAGAFRVPWVLLAEQNLFMDFQVTTALPSDSTIVTCTYTCATPEPYTYNYDQGRACDALEKMGYCVDWARKQFNA